MSMVSSGLAWLQQQLAEHAGEEVVYQAGRETFEIPDAIRGKSEHDSTDAAGTVLRSESIDWLISPSRLTVNGQPIEPAPGHSIVQTVGGITRTFEVQNFEDRCWRYSGPSHDRLRIHSREIPSS